MAPAPSAEDNARLDAVEFKHHTFASPVSYAKGLADLPRRLYYRFGAIWTVEQELTKVKTRSGSSLKASLEWWDMMFFGVGAMVGAGIFVSTGKISSQNAGPAVIISYIVSGISALLSALCYSEFAIEVPTTGGAFTYLRITMGEFASFFTAGNLIMEYVLSAAAVGRGFSGYFASVFEYNCVAPEDPVAGWQACTWQIYVPSFQEGFQYLDPIAVALIVVLTLLLCWGIKESSWFNLVTTVIHLLLMFFIIIAAFVAGNVQNLTQPGGFFPYGISGVFNGAAIAYFSYIGFDAVATMAEECRDPATAIPIGIVGSTSFAIVLYCLMALALGLLVPYDQISVSAPYSVAFQALGWNWAVVMVGLGATLGTVTSTMMSLLGQARYFTMIGRSHMIPLWFARVNAWTCTPINSTVFLATFSAVFAFFTSFDMLLDMVSIGTLFVFFMVAEALLVRRHYKKGVNSPWPVVAFLLTFDATCIAFAICFWLLTSPDGTWWPLVLLGGLAIVEVVAFFFLAPQVYVPTTWHVPLSPWLIAFSIFLNVFLLGSLGQEAYRNFGIFSAVLVGLYLLYSVHATWDLEGEGIEEDDGSYKPKGPDEEDGLKSSDEEGGLKKSDEAAQVEMSTQAPLVEA